MNKYLLYTLKWQLGTPVIALTLYFLPIQNTLIKTIIANIFGACIFYKVDQWIFSKNNNLRKGDLNETNNY